MFVCACMYIYIYLYLSIYLSICLSVCLSVRLSIYPYIYVHVQVWGLRRPQLLISMIGSSFDFDMKGEDRIRLLNELMQLAQQVDAWIITLGLNVGLARFVGDAKSIYI